MMFFHGEFWGVVGIFGKCSFCPTTIPLPFRPLPEPDSPDRWDGQDEGGEE